MEYIVVYDKKLNGNPIVAIHSQRFGKNTVELKDIHPEDDPNERGVKVVSGDIISQMFVRGYKTEKKANMMQKSIEQEKMKELTSTMDSSIGQNILIFGEPFTKIIQITNLMDQSIEGTVVNHYKGIIGIGGNTGLFTVTCKVDTGIKMPEISEDKTNWRWKRDNNGKIIGMELIKKLY